MVFRTHGGRHVLLPSCRRDRPGIPCGDFLHAAKDWRNSRSIHDHGSMVAAVYRSEVLSFAGALWRNRLRGDDGPSGSDGRPAPAVLGKNRMANRQPDTVAPSVFYPRRTEYLRFPRETLRTSNCVDFRSASGWRTSGSPGLYFELSHDGSGYRVHHTGDDETSLKQGWFN